MMPFKCSKHCKIVFVYTTLLLHAVNTVLMSKADVKYQYARQALCAYAHVFFGNDQGVLSFGHVC